ncbi:MAG: cell wall metabolism sensor histidine kinase WalK [Anaerolineae bacterium]|nr:cell wall metabolism sensor histidine kinase WalK [Anaerolineae bacterium]
MQTQRLSRPWGTDLRRIIQTLAAVWIFALALVFLMAQPTLNPPAEDSIQLLVFLGTSSSVSLLIAFLLYRLGLVNWFHSLRYALIVVTLMTIGLVFLNVWITAQLMFLDSHDLKLTVILLIFAGGTAMGFGYFISNALTERIMIVRQGARQLSKGDLSTRVPVSGNDELADLALTFNMMAAQLQELDATKRLVEQSRRDLVAWVSHDLRTPLASLRLVIAALLDGVVDDPQTVNRYLTTAQNEIENLNRLINDLFELAQLDAGHIELRPEQTSLADLISDTLSGMRALAEQRGIRLAGQADPHADPVYVDPEKIQRVLSNLITNAIRHTPSGGTVTLATAAVGDLAEVTVRDSGEGISAADLPHVFERFYRGERARTHESGGQRGVGLGLAIAHGLVEAHGGTITVRSEPEQGAVFTFTLPRHRLA